MIAPEIRFYNRFTEQPNSYRPEKLIEVNVGADGTHFGKIEEEFIPKAPRILDSDEVCLRALERVQIAEHAIAGGAMLDSKHTREAWQRRQVKQENLRDFDLWTMAAGQIKKGKHEVCHQFLTDQRRAQRARWKKFGERTELRNGNHSVLLSDLMEQSMVARKAELYALLKGIQMQAESDGFAWGMLTLTCPLRIPRKLDSQSTSKWTVGA